MQYNAVQLEIDMVTAYEVDISKWKSKVKGSAILKKIPNNKVHFHFYSNEKCIKVVSETAF